MNILLALSSSPTEDPVLQANGSYSKLETNAPSISGLWEDGECQRKSKHWKGGRGEASYRNGGVSTISTFSFLPVQAESV